MRYFCGAKLRTVAINTVDYGNLVMKAHDLDTKPGMATTFTQAGVKDNAADLANERALEVIDPLTSVA
ncbi:hypothetical protein [Palleronia caenipelagi]|uniref:Uncharacterized protein n=1 Tax=Palleronia caenipelagi TaxID=2489174 RepID=A0A547Q913_9RHOB|nr:hypothetical protein [Palleronia caenipelagi]TRD22858.1 hypothetical protein FEV53_03535 [Palleronia caenipelagi]